MLTFPDAWLIAGFARFTAFLLAFTVFAGVSAGLLAGWAVFGTRLRAAVATEKDSGTYGSAWPMNTAPQTATAGT